MECQKVNNSGVYSDLWPYSGVLCKKNFDNTANKDLIPSFFQTIFSFSGMLSTSQCQVIKVNNKVPNGT